MDSHTGGGATILNMRATPEEMNRAGRIGVIQGSNSLGSHFSSVRWRSRFANLTSRLVLVGVGAQSDLAGTLPELPDIALEWLLRIVERAPGGEPNIGVRGSFTKHVLAHHGLAGHAEVIGCPSLFINPDPKLGQTIARNARRLGRVAVVAGHENWRHLGRIEASLSRAVTATDGAYIGQHGLNMMKLTRGEAGRLDETVLEALRAHICPDMNLAEFVRWSRRYGRVFFDVSEWLAYCRKFDLVVGTRIHGTMIALQAGTPAVCIVHDSRTLELCETMGVPHVLYEALPDGIGYRDLPSLFDFDADAFDENRLRLCATYVRFLERNAVPTVAWLREMAVTS